jgi:hypothetical protein
MHTAHSDACAAARSPALLCAQFNNAIRFISSATGNISTIVGILGAVGAFGGDGGAATSARLSNPEGVAVDAYGNIWIADTVSTRCSCDGENGDASAHVPG